MASFYNTIFFIPVFIGGIIGSVTGRNINNQHFGEKLYLIKDTWQDSLNYNYFFYYCKTLPTGYFLNWIKTNYGRNL